MQLKDLVKIRSDPEDAPRARAARAAFWTVIGVPAAWTGTVGTVPESPIVSMLLLVSVFAVLIAWGYWLSLSVDAMVYWQTRGYRADGESP